MAEVARRNTDISDLHVRSERRKSGIFFFNRSFKRDSVPPLGPIPSRQRTRLTKSRRVGEDSQGERPRGRVFSSHLSLPLASNPPYAARSSSTLRSSQSKGDGAESSASTPTTPTLGPVKDGETELKRTDSARSIPMLAQTANITAEAEPLSASPKSATQSLAEVQKTDGEDGDKELNKSTSEGLPTPPDTPGAASTTENAPEEEAGPVSEEPAAEPVFPTELAAIEKRVSYHDDADLYVHARELDGTDAVYSVRACVLETVSPVWKESLASRTSNVLDLAADPAFGLNILFSISHYIFASLPQETDLQALYEIAVAANRFQALHLLVPFVKSWLASLDPSTLADGTNLDKALVLSWILGDAQLFSKTLYKCAYQAQISPDGVLLNASGNAWSSEPVSKEVQGLIAATRLDAIEQIIKAVSTPVNKLLNPQWYPEEENVRYCHAPEDDNAREYCEQLQLGSAIMGLSKAKLWPPPEASRIRASAAELAASYKEIRMRRYQVPGLRFQETEEGEKAPVDVHATCGFGHHEAFDEILSKPTPLFGSVVSELLAHAKTSGAYSEALFMDFEQYLPKAAEEEPQSEE